MKEDNAIFYAKWSKTYVERRKFIKIEPLQLMKTVQKNRDVKGHNEV